MYNFFTELHYPPLSIHTAANISGVSITDRSLIQTYTPFQKIQTVGAPNLLGNRYR